MIYDPSKAHAPSVASSTYVTAGSKPVLYRRTRGARTRLRVVRPPVAAARRSPQAGQPPDTHMPMINP